MQCRKLEPHIVTSSRPYRQQQPESDPEPPQTTTKVKVNRSPQNKKQQVINVQQQIIIQQMPKSPPRKIKKKKKTKKKPQDIQRKQEVEEHVKSLLQKNLKKFQKHKQEESLKKEIQKQRVSSFKEMKKQLDQQIRAQNQTRFSGKRSSASGLPWGINQNKLKDYWNRMLEIHQKLEQPTMEHSTENAIKEKLRRHKLGLDFLNAKPEREVKKIISKQKSKQVLDTINSPTRIKNNFSKEEEEQVKLYMQYKKEFWRRKSMQEKQLKQIQKEKIHSNLLQLQQEAKRNAKSRNASVKSFSSLVTPPIMQNSKEPPNFGKLEQEYKQLMRSMRQSSYTSTKSNSRRVSTMKFVDWLAQLPEAYLQEQLSQMQQINEQMNSQGFMYKLSEQELYSFLEQFLKEKFEQQSKATLKERFAELQGRYIEQQNLPSKVTEREIEQEQSLNEEQIEEVYNQAAIMIQKVWRGYKTRQLVFEYLQYLLQQQEEEEQQREQYESIAYRDESVGQSEQPIADESSFQPLVAEHNQAQSKVSLLQSDQQDYSIEHLERSSQSEYEKLKQQIQQSPQSQLSKQQRSQQQSFQQQQIQKQQLLHLQEIQKQHPYQQKYLDFNNSENLDNSEMIESRAKASSPKIPQLELLCVTPIAALGTPNSSAKKRMDPDFQTVFNMKEETLQMKYQQQLEILNRMLDNKKVSSDSFHEHKQMLESRWQKEREKLAASRSELERIQDIFKETIRSTQKDQQLLERYKHEDTLSFRQLFSVRSETEQSELDIHDRFRLYQKPKQNLKKSFKSFEQQVSLHEVSVRNEEIQTSQIVEVQAAVPTQVEKPQDPLYIKIEEQANLAEEEEVEDSKIEPGSPQVIIPFDDHRIENVTENIVQQIIHEFAEELNNFPLQSLGVLMEWDEENIEEISIQGFPTALNFIKDYLIAFSEYLQNNHLTIFLEQINTPLGITPSDLLKTISLSDINPSVDDSQQGPLYPLIKHIHQMEPLIDEDIWNNFNELYKDKLKFYNNSEADPLRELELFHLRMVYEAFNEAINYVRPYGLRGQPYPWKSNPLKIYCNKTTADNIERAMGFAIAKMLKWGAFLCGFIPEKIETPQGELIVIEDDYLNQIKEDRLQQMLEYEIQDGEEKWNNYDEEQAEVAVELADVVFEFLLDEASEEIFRFI